MLAIGIVFGFVGLGYLCWLLFDLIVYALPVIVGINAGMAAYHSGAGEIGAFIVGFVAGVLTFVAGQIAVETSRSVVIRTAIALLFVVPAAMAGYFATLDLARLGVPAVAWQQAFALFGAVAVGATAWVRVTHPIPPDAEQTMTGL
jgi:hypothetical protein